MKTSDFLNEVTVDSLNAKLRKDHGISVDIAKYSKAQLESYSKRIDAKLKEFETKTGFNEGLESDSYQKNQLIKQIVETAINQYIETPLENVDEEDLGEDLMDVDATDEDVARDFAEDDKEEEQPEEPEADEKSANVSSQAMAALRAMLDDPSQMGMARRAVAKLQNHEKAQTLTPQEVEAIRGPLEKFFLPILDKGMAGVTRTKPLLKTLGAEESMQEGYAKMPLKADVMKCVKDGMSEAEICEKYKDCDKDKVKLMASSCMKEYKKNESVIREGEEDKATVIMAAKDMVDRFTSFLEDVAEMSAEGMLQIQDQIREELGQEQAEQFAGIVAPALESTIENLKQSREALTSGVGVITGEAEPTDTMGADPEMAPEVDPEAPADEPMDMPADDEFGASEPAAGGTEPEGREKRESYEAKKKSISESNRLLSTLSK